MFAGGIARILYILSVLSVGGDRALKSPRGSLQHGDPGVNGRTVVCREIPDFTRRIAQGCAHIRTRTRTCTRTHTHTHTHVRTPHDAHVEGPERRTLRARASYAAARGKGTRTSSRSVQHLAAASLRHGRWVAVSGGGTSRLIMRTAAAALAATAALALLLDAALARHQHRSGNGHKPSGDISLWIDQQQIKMFSGESFTFAATRFHLPLQ